MHDLKLNHCLSLWTMLHCEPWHIWRFNAHTAQLCPWVRAKWKWRICLTCQCCWYRYRKWKDTVNTRVEIILIISHSRCGLQVWFSSHHWWFEFFWPICVVVYFSWCYDLNDGEYKHKHNEVAHCDNCYVASKSDHWLSLRVVIIGQGLIFKIWRHMASAWTACTSAWAFLLLL